MPTHLLVRYSSIGVFAFACVASTDSVAATCYVAPNAPPANSGATWIDATALQTALSDTNCTEVWVAAGVYKPTALADRTISFRISAGVAVYGGFAGTESARSQRDPAINTTVLSGDIDNNDLSSIALSPADIQGSNSYHVVYLNGKIVGQPITGTTVLDGFVITAGAATGSGNDGYGGGLFCDASLNVGAACNPALSNLVFSGNRATVNGGAMQNWAIYGGSASPSLVNVTFRGNAVINGGGSARGGAIYNEGYGGVSSPTLVNVTFADNHASNGGSGSQGGAMYNSGYYGTSNPSLTNVTFSGNSADLGGAIYDDASGSSVGQGTCHPALVNVILWGNSPSQIEEANGAAATITYSVVEGGCPATAGPLECDGTLITTDPKLETLQLNGGFAPTFALGIGSSAIDTGSDAACPASDERGVARPQRAHCDIGAFESDRIFANGFETQ